MLIFRKQIYSLPFKEIEQKRSSLSEDIFFLNFLAICYDRVWVDLKVQTVFLYQTRQRAVRGQASVERCACSARPL